MKYMMIMSVMASFLWGANFVQASDDIDGAKLFNKKCKMCHAMDKKKIGPAVNTMNSDTEALRSAIANGKKRMPKYGHKLSEEEIDALVMFIQAQSVEEK